MDITRYRVLIYCPGKGACGLHDDAPSYRGMDDTFVETVGGWGAALRRAGQLGRNHPQTTAWQVSPGQFASAMRLFGTMVQHEVTPVPDHPRHLHYCSCGAWLDDDAAVRDHLKDPEGTPAPPD